MGVCDSVVVIDFGNKIAEGTPEEIRNDPSVIEAYLGQQSDDELGIESSQPVESGS
jgi:branched-chain amino acid transport system ATP-binding protein